MQESRLFKIIYHLVNEGSSTASQLAEKFEVSVRTIYRDIDVISSVGIPIYATQGNGGGIAIAETFILDKSFLSADEKEQVLMALQGFIATDGNHQSVLLSKLASLFQAQSSNWIEVDFTDWTKGNVKEDAFDQLKQAIFKRNIVSFQYFSGKDHIATRKVAPLKLIFKSKARYLYGYCYDRKEPRFFKLTRIRQLVVLKEEFSSTIQVPETVGKQMVEETTIPVFLKFDQQVAFRVYDEFQEGIVEDEQGDLYVHTSLPDNNRLYSYLFSYLHHVEVLEPLHIRKQLEDMLIKMIDNYRT